MYTKCPFEYLEKPVVDHIEDENTINNYNSNNDNNSSNNHSSLYNIYDESSIHNY